MCFAQMNYSCQIVSCMFKYFQIMHKLLFTDLKIFRLNKSLLESSMYAFSANNNPKSFFKRPPERKPFAIKTTKQQIDSMMKAPVESNKGSIRDVLQDYERYFTQQRQSLPAYLCKITKVLNEQIFRENQQILSKIYYKINKYSSQLTLKSHQFLEIIIFLQKYLCFYSKQRPVETLVVNNGFEHRATILAATFLYNAQFTLTQSIAVFQILTKIGSISMLFLANLTKVLKNEFKSTSAKEKVKIQHILTILNTYFLKSNHTILQNVLYDMTLNYFLKNEYLIHSNSSVFKVQIICLLLRFDLMEFYLSDKNELKMTLQRLVNELSSTVEQQGIGLTDDTHQINLHHAISLMDCCHSFQIRNRHDQINIKINNFCKVLCNRAFLFIKRYSKSSNKINKQLIVRIIFNKYFFLAFPSSQQRNEAIQMIQYQYFEQKQCFPIIQFYYDCLDQKKFITEYINKVYLKMLKNQLFFPKIIKIIMQSVQKQRIISIVQDITLPFIQKSPKFIEKDHFALFGLLNYAQIKNSQVFAEEKMMRVTKQLALKLKELSKDKINYIKYTSQVLMLFTNSQVNKLLIQKWFDGMMIENYAKIAHPNQFQRNQHQIACLHILTQSISCDNHKTVEFPPIFHENIIYSFLLLLYPTKTEYSMRHVKSLPFLQNDQTFQQNTHLIVALASKIQKYSYLLWDIFNSNYRFRSQTVRLSSFGVLKQLFMTAFLKQNARRVVLLTIWSNYVSAGIIRGSKQQLRQVFQACLLPIVSQDLQEKFHYHCFLQITCNASSFGILSDEMFTKIIARYLSSTNADRSSFKTSLLLLLYGMTMKESPNNIYLAYYHQQIKYLQIQLNSKSIIIFNSKQHKQHKSEQRPNKNMVIAAGKYISVILSYAQVQVLKIGNQAIIFIEECDNFCQLMMMFHSFNVKAFELQNPLMREFVSKMNKALFRRLNYFYKQEVLSKSSYQDALKIIEFNTSKVNDYQK